MLNSAIYHVFRKPKTLKNGRSVHRWYYYWQGADGRKVQRACSGCTTRAEAEDYIRRLEPPPDAVSGPGGPRTPIRDITRDMYLPGSAHLGRRGQLGKSAAMETMLESRRYISRITELWGNVPLADLQVETVMTYLFGVERSGSWKNRFLDILGEVYKEAPWYQCKVAKPVFQRFATHSRKADILTTEEIHQLFQPQNFPDYQLYLFFLLCLSGGMRLGEVRAVRAKQLVIDAKVLIIDGFCKADGQRTVYNKTGSPDEPKFRLVYLPDFTVARMDEWIHCQGLEPEAYCFSTDGKPIRKEYLVMCST
jgi:integrase